MANDDWIDIGPTKSLSKPSSNKDDGWTDVVSVTSNKDEGAVVAGVRGAAEGVVPGFAGLGGFGAGMTAAAPLAARAAAMVPGVGVPGLAAKALVGGAVAITGGLAGAFGASSGAAWVQDKLYALTDPEGYKKSQLAKQQHPTASAVGSVVGGLAGMSPKTIPEVAGKFFTKPLVQRGTSAALTGAMDVGVQAATEDKIDWTRAAASAAGGFAAPGFNPAGRAAYNLGERLATRKPITVSPDISSAEDTTKPPTSAETDASKRIEANLREAELSTSSGKRLREAAFMDTETGEYIPQGKSHDEMLKTNPKLIQGFLTEDNSFVTREEAAIIAKEQHADKLVEEIDSKQGLRSSNFGPERMDALKPKDLAFYTDKLKELYYEKKSREELLDQQRSWDVEQESIDRQEKYIAKLQEQIDETQKLQLEKARSVLRPADLVELESKAAVQKEDDIFFKYERIKQQHEDALASPGKYSKEQVEALNQQRLSLRAELLSAKLATIKNPALRKMALEAGTNDPFLNSNNISNVGDLVRHLKSKFGDNHYISQMLDVLNVDPYTNTFVLSVDEFKRQAQKYGASLTAPAFWNDQGIFIVEGRGTNAIVVAHEIGHAALATKIEQIQALPANHPDAVRLKKLVSNIENILADVKSKVDLNNLSLSGKDKLNYALKDVHEFISDGLFQPTVIQELMAIDRANPNLGFIDKILKAVSDFFGMNSKQYTAFHDLIASVSKLSEVDMPNTAAYMQSVDPNSTAPRPSSRGASETFSSSKAASSDSESIIVRDKRVVEADILRTIAEQQKRSRLLGNGVELAAYAKDKGISIEEMRKVLKNNFITNEIYLKKYQEEIKTAPSANTSDIKFTDKASVSLDSKRKDIFNEDSDTAKAWIAIGRNGMSQPIAERFSTRSRDEAEREIYKKYLTKKDILEAARIQGNVKPSFTTEEGSAGNQYIQNLLNERSNGRYLDEIKELKKAKPTEMARAKEDFGETIEDKRTDAEKARDTMAYNRERVEFLKKTPEELQDLAAQHADSEAYDVQAEAYQEAKTEGVTLSDKELEQIRNNSYQREYEKELTRLQKRQENLKYKPVPSKGASPESESIKYEDKPGSDLEIWKQKILKLHKETSASEKESDPDTWTPQEKAAWKSEDWKEFSRLRGYSEKEIKVFQEYLDTVQEGVDKHGWSLEDIQSWELFGEQTISSKESGAASASPDPVAVDPRRYDPRRVTDEADLKLKGKELYASKGADAAREFFTGYEKYKETWLNPVKEVEDFVEMNINNKMADERLVTNNSNDLKALVPDAVAREQVAIAIDAKKTDTLTGAAKEAADKYNGLMKDIGERALKEGVVRGLLENYVTHIVNWADMPKGALETFLNETLGTGSSPRDPGIGMTPESRFGKERKIATFANLDLVLRDINRRIALAGKDFKLEVKTKDIAEIYKEYALSMEKAIENKKLIDSVLTIRNPNGESLVRRVTAEEPLPYGWQMINDRQFAGYAVHPDLAPALKFAFEAQGNKIIDAIYTVSQVTKRLNVVGSLFHAKSLMEVLSSAHTPIITPLKEIAFGVTDKLLGTEYSGIRKAINEFEKGGLGSSVDKWQRGGLVLEVPSDVSKGIISATGKFADSMISRFGPKTRILESALSATEKYTLGVFDKITWDYLHTGGKLMTAEAYLSKARENAAKEGKPFDETAARKEIVSFVNKSFGGLNWFQEARPSRTPDGAPEQANNIVSQTYKKFSDQMAMAAYSPEGRKGLQIMLFAPDWTISTIKAFTAALPKELNPTKWHPIEGIKGMATPSTKADYARLYQFKTALTYLTLINGINLAVSGRNVWENKDPTRIEYPDGTSMQAMKHAMEPYHWIADPDKTLTNKLGFVPKAVAVGITGLEYASPYAPKMLDPSAVNRAKAIASMVLPFQASAAISAPKGEGVNRALLGTVGLPVYGQTKEQRKENNAERAKQKREIIKGYKEKERESGRQ